MTLSWSERLDWSWLFFSNSTLQYLLCIVLTIIMYCLRLTIDRTDVPDQRQTCSKPYQDLSENHRLFIWQDGKSIYAVIVPNIILVRFGPLTIFLLSMSSYCLFSMGETQELSYLYFLCTFRQWRPFFLAYSSVWYLYLFSLYWTVLFYYKSVKNYKFDVSS